MGTGKGRGDNRSITAARQAISNPLLEDLSIKGAKGVLLNVTGGPTMTLHEVNQAASLIQEEAHEDANIIFGSVIQEDLDEEVRVTVIATGLSDASRTRRRLSQESRIDNVTPLHPPVREDVEPEEVQPEPLGTQGLGAEGLADSTLEVQGTRDDFISPFDEEFDVPAFIRKTRESM